MNRPIEFRGMRADTKEWVFGYLVVDPNGNYRIYSKPFEDASSNTWHYVIPETVGQFTGFNDIDGNKVFEGDKDKDGYVLMYNKELGLFAMHSYYSVFNKWSPLSYPIDFSRVKIIGTIHD